MEDLRICAVLHLLVGRVPCPWTCWICLYPNPSIAPSCGLLPTSA